MDLTPTAIKIICMGKRKKNPKNYKKKKKNTHLLVNASGKFHGQVDIFWAKLKNYRFLSRW